MANTNPGFCHGALWDEDRLFHAQRPGFTECFRDTVCIYLPCLFLWLFLPYYICLNRKETGKRSPRKWPLFSKWFIAKLSTVGAAFALCLTLFIIRVSMADTSAGSLGAFILTTTLVYDIWAIYLHKRAVHMSSYIQFFFWLLVTLFSIPELTEALRTLSKDEETASADLEAPLATVIGNSTDSSIPGDAPETTMSMAESTVWLIFFILSVLSLLIHCFSDIPQGCCEDYNPEERASAFSDLFYFWMDPLIWAGYKNPLEAKDIPPLRDDLKAQDIAQRLDKHLNIMIKQDNTQAASDNATEDPIDSVEMIDIAKRADENSKKKLAAEQGKVNFVLCLIKGFGWRFALAISLKLVQDLLKFVSPQILKKLIRFVQDESIPGLWQGYALAVLLFCVNVVQLTVLQQYWRRAYLTGMEMKTAAISAIYRKSFLLSHTARRDYTTGQIVNLVTSDAQTLQDVLPSLNMVWSMPLQIILALVFLYAELGPSLFSGVVILILLVPFNIYTGRLNRLYTSRQMKCKDSRIRAMYEILGAMRIIKLNAWEESFQQKVSDFREKEVGFLRRNAILKSFINFVFGSAPILVTLASFATYVNLSEDNVLTADKVFVCLSLFNLLRLPMHLLPFGITEALRLHVSLTRMNKFLNAGEMAEERVIVGPKRTESDKENDEDIDTAVEIENGTFSWGGDLKPSLEAVNVKVPHGSLVAVVGRVGAGKSSLLAAILGEMEKIKGTVRHNCETMALVAQQPWIQNLSVKNNIVFGGLTTSAGINMDEDRWYKKVVEACALDPDFAQLSEGDQTLIGEQGINLSGGQKQRVSIARAVYKKAELYLFDDPLSALDSHTASHVFEHVISNFGVLKGSTRILVTHRTNIIPQADFIAVVKDGAIAEFGPSNQILSRQNSELSLLMEEMVEDESLDESSKDTISNKRESPAKKIESESEEKPAKELSAAERAQEEVKKRLKDEAVLTGRVKTAAYQAYFKALGYISSGLIVIVFLGNQAISTGSTIWLATWSDHNQRVLSSLAANESSNPSIEPVHAEFDNSFYLSILGAFGAGQAIVSFVRNWLFFTTCAKGSVKLHNILFDVIMRARMRFFDTTPTGSIVNRFGSDLSVIDLPLPQALSGFLFTSAEVLSVLVVISISTPVFLAFSIPLALVYALLLRVYIPTSRQVKRFESTSKSPINLHFSETIQGAVTIRAFDQEKRFYAEILKRAETNMAYQYTAVMCQRWVNIRSEFFGNIVVLLSALLAVSQKGSLSAGWVGLVISCSMSITETFNFVMINGSRCEEQAVSVERIRETVEMTPVEGVRKNPDADPDGENWLQKGSVQLKDFTMAYSPELDPVLHNLTLDISPGEKIGICGRTGAGKSSLTAALFNLVESFDGTILLDGVDIKKIGLHTLRSQLTIIPQDPILFHTSVRNNLDPCNKHSDEAIWNALELSQLKEVISELDKGLQHEVEEGGSNFSVGQRQLLCLARALLRNSAIVILDEATASMDQSTDDLVQETLFKELDKKTLITIAHRLDTILNYDRILVLDRGHIKEFDTPNSLMEDKNSQFYGMMQEDINS